MNSRDFDSQYLPRESEVKNMPQVAVLQIHPNLI